MVGATRNNIQGMHLTCRRAAALTAVSKMLRSVGFLIFLASTLVGQQKLHELQIAVL
jgi:hypothetical protein